MSQHFTGPAPELRPDFVEPSPEEMAVRLDLSAQPDNHTLPNASIPELTPLPAPDDEIRDFHRVDKMAYNSALALFSISVTLLLTNPQPDDHPGRVVVYAASTALACLSLVAVVALIYYSIISHPSAQLAKVQKMAMGFSAVTLVLSALSRLALLMPFLLFLAVTASVILLAGLLRLPIYLARKLRPHIEHRSYISNPHGRNGVGIQMVELPEDVNSSWTVSSYLRDFLYNLGRA